MIQPDNYTSLSYKYTSLSYETAYPHMRYHAVWYNLDLSKCCLIWRARPQKSGSQLSCEKYHLLKYWGIHSDIPSQAHDIAVYASILQYMVLFTGKLTPSPVQPAQDFRLPVWTRWYLHTEGGSAMSMRSTRGCGSLGVEGPAWEGWQSSRLQWGRPMQARHRRSVEKRPVGVARRIRPDSK